MAINFGYKGMESVFANNREIESIKHQGRYVYPDYNPGDFILEVSYPEGSTPDFNPSGTYTGPFYIGFTFCKDYTVVTSDSDMAGVTFTSNITSINWGDGTIEYPEYSFDSDGSRCQVGLGHVYEDKTKKYTIKINGSSEIFAFHQSVGSVDRKIVKIMCKILQFGSVGTKWIKFDYITGLTRVETPFGKNHTSLMTAKGMFSYCPNLEFVPTDLFANCSNIINANITFYACRKLLNAPTFNGLINITNIASCFSGCILLKSIPSNLLNGLVNVVLADGLFNGCTSLTNIPQGLLDSLVNVLDISNMFSKCSNISTIPVGLFDNLINVENLSKVFWNCVGLLTIPQNLFTLCTKIKNIKEMFWNCDALTFIPEGLFSTLTLLSDIRGCFESCSNIISIPYSIFDTPTRQFTTYGTDFLAGVIFTQYVSTPPPGHTGFFNKNNVEIFTPWLRVWYC